MAEFKSKQIRLTIDYGWYSGTFKNDASKLDFKEEFVQIDDKKVQIVTYKEPGAKGKFIAGLYALIKEVEKSKVALNMSAQVKSEQDLATVKQIFLSLHFDGYTPFTVE